MYHMKRACLADRIVKNKKNKMLGSFFGRAIEQDSSIPFEIGG